VASAGVVALAQTPPGERGETPDAGSRRPGPPALVPLGLAHPPSQGFVRAPSLLGTSEAHRDRNLLACCWTIRTSGFTHLQGHTYLGVPWDHPLDEWVSGKPGAFGRALGRPVSSRLWSPVPRGYRSVYDNRMVWPWQKGQLSNMREAHWSGAMNDERKAAKDGRVACGLLALAVWATSALSASAVFAQGAPEQLAAGVYESALERTLPLGEWTGELARADVEWRVAFRARGHGPEWRLVIVSKPNETEAELTIATATIQDQLHELRRSGNQRRRAPTLVTSRWGLRGSNC
jgi:hypothetical protein